MRYRILKMLFAAWAAIWLYFIVRELFIKDNIAGYRALLGRSLEEKRSYVTGDALYSFINFCKANLPKGATYRIEGMEPGSIEMRRAVYYLYPLLEKSDPDYILEYAGAASARPGYSLVLVSDGGCIMKKAPSR